MNKDRKHIRLPNHDACQCRCQLSPLLNRKACNAHALSPDQQDYFVVGHKTKNGVETAIVMSNPLRLITKKT